MTRHNDADASTAITRASACAKAILLGEHAVVYGRPAIAVPIPACRAWVTVRDAPAGGGSIIAHDVGARYLAGSFCVDEHGEFLWAAVEGALRACCASGPWPSLEIEVHSEIPIARGMGSGAAVSAAMARGIVAHLGLALAPERLSELVYDTERLLHGTPSGIDNTVVAYEQAIWYRQGEGAEPIDLAIPLTLLIGDTGIPSRTRASVALVRRCWEAEPAPLEALFDAIAEVVQRGRSAMGRGDLVELGRQMDRNQALLAELGVSDPALERLVAAARQAGALGAKLSGGGMGGCMIALVPEDATEAVEAALRAAGATGVVVARIERQRAT